MSSSWKTVLVAEKRVEAEGIFGFDLVDPRSLSLTKFSAGSHIDVEVAPGLIRQYSLCNNPDETHRYQIAVLREANSRGGSRALADNVSVGDKIRISEPRNHFALEPYSRRVCLLAGGIGITPILSMAEYLSRSGSPFQLHYCTRSRNRTAFYDRIKRSSFSEQATFYFDDGETDSFSLPSVLRYASTGDHLYVCGPAGFIEAAIQTASELGWSQSQLHREFFTSDLRERSTCDQEFSIQIRSTGAIIKVGVNETVVDVLSAKGIDIPTSCEQGVCGTCMIRVISGHPDHRDMFMTHDEHARNDQFTPCCSRAISELLVLDL